MLSAKRKVVAVAAYEVGGKLYIYALKTTDRHMYGVVTKTKLSAKRKMVWQKKIFNDDHGQGQGCVIRFHQSWKWRSAIIM